MNRRDIWDMNCWEIDLVLAMNFDEGELANMMVSCGVDQDEPADCSMARMDYIFALAHALCHDENDFSQSVARHLEYRHQSAIKQIYGMTTTSVAVFSRGAHAWLAYASWVWAMLADTRPQVAQIGSMLLRRRLYQSVSSYEASQSEIAS